MELISHQPHVAHPRFVLMDHSIKRLGGHNLEYAVHVLAAAEQAGFQPVLAVNRQFSATRQISPSWRVLPAYHYTTYEVPKWRARQSRLDPAAEFARLVRRQDGGETCPTPEAHSATWWQWLSRPIRHWLWQRYDRQLTRFIQQFAADTACVWQKLGLRQGDQILLATVMESELAGLVQFFEVEPAALAVDWHLQFHFKLFGGREPDYPAQQPQNPNLARIFADAAALPGQQLKIYCTTDRLVEQYHRITSLPVRDLPWPVNPQFALHTRESVSCPRPLRVGVPGCIRAEKGTGQLAPVVAACAQEFAPEGQMQLFVQSKRLGKLSPLLRESAQFYPSVAAARSCRRSVAVVKWPLGTRDYLEFIRATDIGLLLYDASEYYVRCSGVLVELLAAGKPVIVPAGCWMANQLAEANWLHVEQILQACAIVEKIPSPAWNWRYRPEYVKTATSAPRLFDNAEPKQGLTAGGHLQPATMAEVTVPANCAQLALSWRWPGPPAPGSYLAVRCNSFNAANSALGEWREITGQRASTTSVPRQQGLLIPLPRGTRRCEISLQNAYHNHPLSLADVECAFLDVQHEQPSPPLGKFGLCFADVGMVGHLLRQMCTNYIAYAQGAREQAAMWAKQHSPEEVITQLTSNTYKPSLHQSRAA
ncbi:MAG: hypothetical protein SFX18_13050 [Pirellulales bacterium]|nr:hypothetical protein [Pirellulales bacterium]